MSNSALIGLAPRVQTVGVRDPHRAGRYKGPLVGHSTYPGGLELSTRCTGSSRGLGARRSSFAWSVVSVCVVSFCSRGFFRSGVPGSSCSWGGDFGVRLHASGGRSCKGWRAQRTPRGAQCISSDASLFTIGNSSRVKSSTLHSGETRRRHGVAQLGTEVEIWASGRFRRRGLDGTKDPS